MSSIENKDPVGRAERHFREAFDRLKRGKPENLPRGTKISQANVAREAGVIPSALRKSRFPELLGEIQQWIDANEQSEPASPRQIAQAARRKSRGLREQNETMRIERDDAIAKLVDAEARIVALTNENERLLALLPKSNVSPLRSMSA